MSFGLVKDIVSMICAIIVAYVAHAGLETYKEVAKFDRKFRAIIDLKLNTYAYIDYLNRVVRSPSNDISSESGKKEYDAKREYLSSLKNKLFLNLLEVEAILSIKICGEKLKNYFELLFDEIAEFRTTVYFKNVYNNSLREQGRDPYFDINQFHKMMYKNPNNNDDQFSKKITSVMHVIEDFLNHHLDKRNN